MTDDGLALEHGDGGVVVAAGAVDLASAGRLEAELRAAADGAGRGDVVLDAAAVDFIDSSGLNVLVRVSTELGDRGRRLRVLQPRAIVHRALTIGGLGGLVET